MKTCKRQPADVAWQTKPRAAGAYRHWLVMEGSLTQRLQSRCANFSVAGVRQRWIRPLPDEGAVLGLRHGQRALVREVWLQCGETPVVFARSVLPCSSLRGAWRKLGSLGARPLGAVLFGDERVSRYPLTFRKLSGYHPISCSIGQAGLWARRSVFVRSGQAILVTEAFLPGVLKL